MAFPSLNFLGCFSLFLPLGLLICSPFKTTIATPTKDIESLVHPTQHQQLQERFLLPPTSPSAPPPSSAFISSELDSDAPLNTFTISTVLNDPSPPYAAEIQCWRLLNSIFHTYPTVGKAAFLGDVSNLTYVVLPPRSGEGWHRPPAPMFFVLLSGEAHVSTPKPDQSGHRISSGSPNMAVDADTDLNLDIDTDIDMPTYADSATRNLYITPSRNSVILALDTDLRAPGHLTFYPGRTETVALQIPLSSSLHLHGTTEEDANGQLSVSSIEYEVVSEGPCE